MAERTGVEFRCPRCLGTLESVPGPDAPVALRCTRCTTSFPIMGGVPWLFPEPALMLGEWRNRQRLYLEEIERDRRAAEAALAGSPSAATRARLERLVAAYGEHLVTVSGLLAPLGLVAVPAGHATMNAFGVTLPQRQDLHSYYTNLHRDWCWGALENQLALDAVRAALPDRRDTRLAVLGAGSGRLAYDLHQSGLVGETVALDINPLLVLVAREMIEGRSVWLHEFPLAPRTAAETAVRRELKAPVAVRPGLRLVFGDAFAAPFPPASFDAVLTPWLADIVDEDIASLATAVNRLLVPGGRWIYHGSASFVGRGPADRYNIEEVDERVRQTGFAAPVWQSADMPYMRSPASRHSRVETVLTFASVKQHEAPERPGHHPGSDWLTNLSLPIPLSPALELAGIAARIQAFTLSLVNGERSAAELAEFLVAQGLLDPESSMAAVLGLLQRLTDAERRPPPH